MLRCPHSQLLKQLQWVKREISSGMSIWTVSWVFRGVSSNQGYDEVDGTLQHPVLDVSTHTEETDPSSAGV